MLALYSQISTARFRPFHAAANTQDTIGVVSRHFNLSEEEVQQLLPSGRQKVFANRVAWAKSYLKRAGLLETPKAGKYRITARGQDVLRLNPPRVDLRFLLQYGQPEVTDAAAGEPNETTGTLADAMTPQDHIALGYQRLRADLAQSLLQRVKASPPTFFEQLVVDLLVAMGYGGSRQDAGRAIGRGGDGGVDGIIKEDRLGLDVIYIQAKRWEDVVGRPEIQKFAGALQGQRARKGVFITTSGFSKEARQFVAAIDTKIVLIDGEELALLMIEHGVGVAEVGTFVVKQLDSDYFADE